MAFRKRRRFKRRGSIRWKRRRTGSRFRRFKRTSFKRNVLRALSNRPKPELKIRLFQIQTQLSSNGNLPFVACLTPIDTTGTSVSSRFGNEVSIKKIAIRGAFFGVLDTTDNTGAAPIAVRMLVYSTKQDATSQSAPAWNTFMTHVDLLGFYAFPRSMNSESTVQYNRGKILYDKIITVKNPVTQVPVWDSVSEQIINGNGIEDHRARHWKLFFRFNKHKLAWRTSLNSSAAQGHIFIYLFPFSTNTCLTNFTVQVKYADN